ncbi:MAG: nitrilase-related carbon-nitrogen hydrolase, partial [Pseudomonadota bacterium]
MALRVALAQLNLLVGDVQGNARRVIDAANRARDEQGAQLAVFPELTLTGYPPEDLLLRPEMDERVAEAIAGIRDQVQGIHLVIGYPGVREGVRYNAAGVFRDGQQVTEYHKVLLPNYSVFDEKRYFEAGREPRVFEVEGVPVGITLCEDIWYPTPARRAVEAGARLLINLNASPFHTGKAPEREELVAKRARENRVPVVYVNLVGGQDELVFDGGSFVMAADGRVAQRSPFYVESLETFSFEAGEPLNARAGSVLP